MRHSVLAFLLLPIFSCTLFLVGCSGTRQPNLQVAQENPGTGQRFTEADDPDFSEVLTSHFSLAPETREDLHAQAVANLEGFRRFQKESREFKDAGLRHWYYRDTFLSTETLGVGLGNSIRDLKAATALDPSYAEAWGELGHLCAAAGDQVKAREYLDRARLAAIGRGQIGQPLEHDVQLEIFRDRAWVLRDLALWEEGLAAVEEGLAFQRGDRDLVLIKGLLLAGSGRYEEATSLAVRMKPFDYPEFDIYHYGTRHQTSDYANRWIRSQALLAVGDYELARHVIGELNSYPYRRLLPHQQRFWNDVGLAAELVGDEEAGSYYAIGFISSEYKGFFPWMAGNLEPLILDVPKPETPFFTSFGGRFLVGGSILGYAASQMNMMTMSIFDIQRSQAAWRALLALDLAERRNIRPDVARALRGRVYFSQEDLPAARRDLTAARGGFLEKGRIDPGTSLLLGLLNMDEGKFAEAVPLFEESLAEDERQAVGWRSLGVSLVQLGRKEEAILAMDRSLQLEPRSVSGLYNRGLLHLQNQEFVAAGADLNRAFNLDPENHEVQRLLQMAAAGHRAAGGDPGDISNLTEEQTRAEDEGGAISPDEIMTRLEADIQSFFAVPDSVRQLIGPKDQIVTSLQRQWAQVQDPMVRKILALAYLDRQMFQEAQALLAPGWGVDLSPEEEVMLLYVDRTLGEDQRSRELSDLVLAGRVGSSNPYLLLMTAEEGRRHWTQTIMSSNHYPEGYGAKVQTNADAQRYAHNMLYGFRNIRMATIQPDGSIIAPLDDPFLRNLEDNGGLDSAMSGSRPVSGRKSGNVTK